MENQTLEQQVAAETRRVLKHFHPTSDFIIACHPESKRIEVQATAPFQVKGIKATLAKMLRVLPKRVGWEVVHYGGNKYAINFSF